MKKIIIITILFAGLSATAQVGIGTNTPSANSVLDLTSTNKGILLPRVNDTSVVSNPSAGLMIYNLNTKKPAFHNGTSWSSLASATSAGNGDSITYSISGPENPLFDNGVYSVTSVAISGAGIDHAFMSISKNQDINSIGFVNSMVRDLVIGTIEFKMFVPGAPTPYYSIKFSQWKVVSMSQGLGTGAAFQEAYILDAITVGYKDWINNKSFSINQNTHVIGTY
jgi:hypothetical protein